MDTASTPDPDSADGGGTPSDPEVGRPGPAARVFGDFELLEPIGRGSSGRVWRARHRESGELRAVKVLAEDLCDDQEARARFAAEAAVLADLQLPGVVRIEPPVQRENGRLALVMELLPGPDLRHWLADREPLDPAAACSLGGRIARAISAAHAAGVVHRDLKPENVVVLDSADGPMPVLTDFGLARLIDGATLTRSSRFVGTADYVAPELIGGRRAGPAADIYALGVMLFEMLTGWRPFRGSAAAVMQRHLAAIVQQPDGVPDQLWQWISLSLAKDPEDRPEAAGLADALAELGPALAGLPGRPASEPPPNGAAEIQAGLPTQHQPIRGRQDDPAAPATPRHPSWRRTAVICAAGVAAALIVGAGTTPFLTQRGLSLTGDHADLLPAVVVPATDSTASSTSPDPTSAGTGSSPAVPFAPSTLTLVVTTTSQAPPVPPVPPVSSVPATTDPTTASAPESLSTPPTAPPAQEPATAPAPAPEPDPDPGSEPNPGPPRTTPPPTTVRPKPSTPPSKPLPKQKVFEFAAEDDLNSRNSPNLADVAKENAYKKGDPVPVVCQKKGPKAYGTDIWDRTKDGKWVPDSIVETGTNGFHPDVPRC